MSKHDFELASGGWAASPVPYDPKQIWHTDSYGPGGSNYIGFGNEESDALIEEIRTTMEDDKRHELYLKFQEMIYDEQPYIFLFYATNPIVISKRFNATVSSVRPGFFPNTFLLRDELIGN